MFPFLHSPGTSPDCQDFSTRMGERLDSYVSQFPPHPGIHVISSHRAVPVVYIHQVVSDPLFPYTGWDFALPASIYGVLVSAPPHPAAEPQPLSPHTAFIEPVTARPRCATPFCLEQLQELELERLQELEL